MIPSFSDLPMFLLPLSGLHFMMFESRELNQMFGIGDLKTPKWFGL